MTRICVRWDLTMPLPDLYVSFVYHNILNRSIRCLDKVKGGGCIVFIGRTMKILSRARCWKIPFRVRSVWLKVSGHCSYWFYFIRKTTLRKKRGAKTAPQRVHFLVHRTDPFVAPIWPLFVMWSHFIKKKFENGASFLWSAKWCKNRHPNDQYVINIWAVWCHNDVIMGR